MMVKLPLATHAVGTLQLLVGFNPLGSYQHPAHPREVPFGAWSWLGVHLNIDAYSWYTLVVAGQ